MYKTAARHATIGRRTNTGVVWNSTKVYGLMLENLDEKQKRLYVATEALLRGYGGISSVQVRIFNAGQQERNCCTISLSHTDCSFSCKQSHRNLILNSS